MNLIMPWGFKNSFDMYITELIFYGGKGGYMH